MSIIYPTEPYGLAHIDRENTFTADQHFSSSITGTYALFNNDIVVNGTASVKMLNTINQQSLQIGDKYIIIMSGAADHTSLDGSGILYGSGGVGPSVDENGANAYIKYRSSYDKLEIFPGLRVSGSLTASEGAQISGSNGLQIAQGGVTINSGDLRLSSTGLIKNSGGTTAITLDGFGNTTVNGALKLGDDRIRDASGTDVIITSNNQIQINGATNGIQLSGAITTNNSLYTLGSITSSAQITGSFVGDGSQLTNLPLSAYATLSGVSGTFATLSGVSSSFIAYVTPSTSGNILTSNGTNWVSAPAAGGGGGTTLSFFSESQDTSSPNGTVYANIWEASGSATNIDIVLSSKGSGATLAQKPDSTSTGGDKRGAYATDFQKGRGSAGSVASGQYSSILGGYENNALSNYSVTVGGQNNTGFGAHSFLGGGYYNTNLASQTFIGGGAFNSVYGGNSVTVGGFANGSSAAWTVVVGGYSNYNPSNYAFIGGGYNNQMYGTYGAIAGGKDNYVGAVYASIGGGRSNNADGDYSTIPGGYLASTRTMIGKLAYAGGAFAAAGDAQTGIVVFRGITYTSPTSKLLVSDGGASSSGATTTSGNNLLILQDNSAYKIRVEVVAKDVANKYTKAWTLEGLFTRDSNAASTAANGATTKIVFGNHLSASSWDCNLVADTTNGSANIEVTGSSAASGIKWVATVYTTEVNL